MRTLAHLRLDALPRAFFWSGETVYTVEAAPTPAFAGFLAGCGVTGYPEQEPRHAPGLLRHYALNELLTRRTLRLETYGRALLLTTAPKSVPLLLQPKERTQL